MVFKVKKKAQWNYSDKIFGESATESAVTKLVGKTSKTEAVLKTASGRDIGKKRSDNPGKTEFLSRKGEQESKIKPHVDTSGPTRTLAGTELGKSRELEIAAEKTTSIPDYNYNWPYDYFSLVELVKIDASVTWGSLPEKRTKSPRPSSITRTTDRTVVVEEEIPGRTLGDTRGKK
jgi:hypothetical protein